MGIISCPRHQKELEHRTGAAGVPELVGLGWAGLGWIAVGCFASTDLLAPWMISALAALTALTLRCDLQGSSSLARFRYLFKTPGPGALARARKPPHSPAA